MQLRFFHSYAELAAAWDEEFRRVAARFADRMQCRKGCSMCCSQMFSISAIEAAVIADAVARMEPGQRDRLRARARRYLADARDQGLLRRDSEDETVAPRPGARLTCPALEHDACSIYDARPLICRKWGIPVFDPSKPERLYACELNFDAGEPIDGGDLVEPQRELLVRWAAVKDEWRDAVTGPVRSTTVAEAILDVGDQASPGGRRAARNPSARPT